MRGVKVGGKFMKSPSIGSRRSRARRCERRMAERQRKRESESRVRDRGGEAASGVSAVQGERDGLGGGSTKAVLCSNAYCSIDY